MGNFPQRLYVDEKHRQVGGVPLVPPTSILDGHHDLTEIVIMLYRFDSLCRHFECTTPGDRLHMYTMWFISKLLQCSRPEMTKKQTLDLWNKTETQIATMPNDNELPFSLVASGKSEEEALKEYLKTLRRAIVSRLLDHVYANRDHPSKWWLCYGKRKLPHIV